VPPSRHASNGSSSNGSPSNGSSPNGSSPNVQNGNGRAGNAHAGNSHADNGRVGNGHVSNGAPALHAPPSPPAVDEAITKPMAVPPPPPVVGPDNVVALDTSVAKPKRPARAKSAKPARTTEGTDQSDAAPVALDDRPTRPAPNTTPGVAVPATAPRPGPPPATAFPIDPGMMPGPAALAPMPVPRVVPIPALFDDDESPTGPLAFDRLFDPESAREPHVRPARAEQAPRQRSLLFTQTGRRSRPRVRRVTRVVRHVDPWSVFKVALCFSLVFYGVCLTAGVLLWNVAYTTGTIDNVQRFFESFGWDTFRFKGGELYHNAWIAGLFASLGLTGLIVLTATLFNLITDLVGGIRITVLEEEVVERNPVVKGPLLRRRTRTMAGIGLGIRPGQPSGSDRGSDDLDDPFG
jgi:hypothetical protein